jgi:thiamine-monophosphate kinase
MQRSTSKSVDAEHGGELALLREIRRRAGRQRGGGLSLGIGDDCALLLPGPEEELCVTTDLSIAGRHFRMDWHSPEAVGHRVLARGLSDIAAMGARPFAAFLSLGLPAELTAGSGRRQAWVDRFFDGLLRLAQEHRTPLAGGDLAESPLPLADIVLVGAVARGRALLRSGAKPGDQLYVTGNLGGAASGLELLGSLPARKQSAITAGKVPASLREALQPHLYPQPRIRQGQWLVQRRAATAAIDLSDGLSTDLTHLCEESRLAAEVDARTLPIDAGATLAQALHGGEDYELLFTATPATRIPATIAGVQVTRIGRMIPQRRGRPRIVLCTDKGSQPLAAHGWEHFLTRSRRSQ